VIQTSNGGYAVGGTANDGGLRSDAWILKTDSLGNQMWNRTYGGVTGYSSAYSVIQTSSGGYMLAGCTASYGAGGDDFWLIKVEG